MPEVSVVIPCYNRARYVREAVDSALAQTETSCEVIAVDDGSSDETPAILASYGDRIRVITQANAGLASARNAGIAAACGAWLAWLDSDDVWEPEKLACQLAVARRWPHAALIHTRCTVIDGDGVIVTSEDSPATPPDALEQDNLERLLVHCYPTMSSVIVRREALNRVGVFRPDWRSAEEWEWCLRLAEVYPFASTGRKLTRYRVHGESLTANRLPHTLGLIRLRRAVEERKSAWLQSRDTPALRRALRRHVHEYAHVYGRLGLIYQQRGEPLPARDAFRDAMRLEPHVLKHRLRYLRMVAAAARHAPARPTPYP